MPKERGRAMFAKKDETIVEIGKGLAATART
jgi:hypothetical protein